jgi:hypothetical protein
MVSDRFGEISQKWQKLKEKYTQLKTDNSLKYLSWSPKQAKIFQKTSIPLICHELDRDFG